MEFNDEPLHMMAQLEAFSAAREARIKGLREAVEREKRETANAMRRDESPFPSPQEQEAPLSPEDRQKRDLGDQEKQLRLKERALEDRVFEVKNRELERLRVLDDKEQQLRHREETWKQRLEEREADIDKQAEAHKRLVMRQEESYKRERKELDDRAKELDALDKELQERSRRTLQREAELIARGKELETRERTLHVKEKDVEERTVQLVKNDALERDRMRQMDEMERAMKLTEERSKKDLAERWKLLEENIYLFETKQTEEQLRLKRRSRDLEEREIAVEKLATEVRVKEQTADDLRLHVTQREMRLNDIEQRAVDRLKREISERESNLKPKYQPDSSTSLYATPTRTHVALHSQLTQASPPTHNFGSTIPQSPPEVSPDSQADASR
ncbi:hypothetical protein DIPPA_22375 [Diplonema papillatum]|nr:hypothetical protein DIPPA_22375 [Diplonema papillatum]